MKCNTYANYWAVNFCPFLELSIFNRLADTPAYSPWSSVWCSSCCSDDVVSDILSIVQRASMYRLYVKLKEQASLARHNPARRQLHSCDIPRLKHWNAIPWFCKIRPIIYIDKLRIFVIYCKLYWICDFLQILQITGRRLVDARKLNI